MMKFVETLRAFRSGAVCRKQALAQIPPHLGDAGTDAIAMLAELDEEHARAAFPKALHAAIARKILDWLGVARAGEMRAAAPPFKDSDRSVTVVFRSPDADTASEPVAVRPAADQTTAVAVGSVLQHRFKLVGHIGEGGMSRVYKAVDLRKVEGRLSDPYVAIKLLTVPIDDYKHSIAVLQSEAQKLQSLAHPHIVRVIDCDRDGQTVFMTMEYLDGEPLKRKFLVPQFAGLARDEALRIVAAIASALQFAHGLGIVHGDLKPGNVIITAKGEVKVIDFGIARMMAPKTPPAARQSGEAVPHWDSLTGLTPSYASPQMLEHQAPDPRDDIYALACIAYEALTGRHPFGREAANVARERGLQPMHAPALSRRQLKALAHGLEFDRDARTASAVEFIGELRGAQPLRAKGWIAAAGVLLAMLVAGMYWLRGAALRTPAAARHAPQAATQQAPLLTPGKVFRDCPTCPLMTVLPPGHFEQGAADEDAHATAFERPRHAVALAYSFGMGVNEITKGEFKEFIDATGRAMDGCETYDGAWRRNAGSSWNEVGYPQTPLHPVSCVSWQDAQAYVQWLSSKTGHRYRLPSASEWEYAAQGDGGADCGQANIADATAVERFPGWRTEACSDGYVYTAPVGSFAANRFGLHDMLGNVFEWTEDCWQDDYAQAPGDGAAQLQGDCRQREMRGGSWFTQPAYARSTYRNRFADDFRSSSVGFRIVRDLKP